MGRIDCDTRVCNHSLKPSAPGSSSKVKKSYCESILTWNQLICDTCGASSHWMSACVYHRMHNTHVFYWLRLAKWCLTAVYVTFLSNTLIFFRAQPCWGMHSLQLFVLGHFEVDLKVAGHQQGFFLWPQSDFTRLSTIHIEWTLTWAVPGPSLAHVNNQFAHF